MKKATKYLSKGGRYVAHEAEVVPYTVYWLSRQGKGDFTLPQRQLVEHAGLKGDRILDRAAGTGDRDENRMGHIFPKLPFIGYWGPETWLYGVHKNGKEDFR